MALRRNGKAFLGPRRVEQSALPVAAQEAPSEEDQTSMWGINKHSLMKAGIAVGLSLVYGNYLDNRIFASNKELWRAGIMGGSVIASEVVSNKLLPHLQMVKENGSSTMEHMVIEPALAGIFYTAGKYAIVDGEAEQSNMMYDFAKGASVNIGSGVVHSYAMQFY